MNQSQNIDTSSTQDIEHSRVISNDVQPLAKNKETVTQVSDNKGNNNAVNVPPLPVEKKEEVKQVVGNKIFDIAEQMPSFKGNVNQWLASNLSYPAIAAENGVQGCVIVQFVVEKGGSVSNVQVVRSIDPALDHEAVRVVKSMPKWNPGMNNGQPIRVKYTLPITFRLQ